LKIGDYFQRKFMPSIKDIRRRIKSIKSTSKITRAMEMVSAAKMRKAVGSVLKIRAYALNAWGILTNLARAFEKYHHGLLEVRDVKNILLIVITSSRGLCGSFNAQIGRKIKDELSHPEKLSINRIGGKKIQMENKPEKIHPVKSPQSGVDGVEFNGVNIDFLTVGKKGENIVRKLGGNIIAAFPDLVLAPELFQIKPISQIVTEEYLKKKYDKVAIIYTDYISTINQKTKIRQVLPISKIDIEKQISEMDRLAKAYELEIPALEYKVEPNPKEVLETLFPKIIEMQIFHAILESNASEHSARMMAMRNATDAGEEMSQDLTLAYNQIRQGKITQEIAEISAGRAALEN
jgi:F-type H+-transporting ATPase subunit gamma